MFLLIMLNNNFITKKKTSYNASKKKIKTGYWLLEERLSSVFLSLKQILTTPIVKFVLQKTLDETSYQLK